MDATIWLALFWLVVIAGLCFWEAREERKMCGRLIEANWVMAKQVEEVALSMIRLMDKINEPKISLDSQAVHLTASETVAAARRDEDRGFYDRAKALVQGEGYGSPSLIRSGLGVGYGRACRILRELTETGVLLKTKNRRGFALAPVDGKQ